MILIIGGAYQGKLAYALEISGLTDADVYKCDGENIKTPENKRIIHEIDKWILAMVKADIDVAKAVRKFIDSNTDAIVTCNDISCGIVPDYPALRKWREAAGRSLAEISRYSNGTVRVFCGIPTRIK